MENSECVFCSQLANLPRATPEDLIANLPHSVVLLGPWQFYQGYCVVVFRRHAAELSQLPEEERLGYYNDMCRVAGAIEDCFQPRKLNYELLGNLVPHLHWHLFPRYESDPEVLRPVWLALDRAERDPAEKQRLQSGLLARAAIADALRKKLT